MGIFALIFDDQFYFPLPLPNFDARLTMMKMHMRDMPKSLSEDECNAFLARLTEGASGSKPIWKCIKAVKERSIDKFMNAIQFTRV